MRQTNRMEQTRSIGHENTAAKSGGSESRREQASPPASGRGGAKAPWAVGTGPFSGDAQQLELRLLKCFAIVAEELHFGRAAERLFMTQPPLSQSIRRLEDALGVPLLLRNTRSVRLTSAGEELQRRIATLDREMHAALRAVRSVHEGRQGHLRIGLTPSASYSSFPQCLYAFRKAYPGVHVDVVEMNSSEMPDALRHGRLDMALMRPPFADQDLAPERVLAEPLVYAVRKDHPMAREGEHRPLPLAQALANELIGYSRSTSQYFSEILQRLARLAAVTPNIVHESMIPTVLALVEAGIGAAIVPANLARARSDSLAYLPLTGCGDIEAELLLARSPQQANAAVDNFLAIMRGWDASHAGS